MNKFIVDGKFDTKAFGESITEKRVEYLTLESRVQEMLASNYASNIPLSTDLIFTTSSEGDIPIKTMAISLSCEEVDLAISFPISSPNLSADKIIDILDELIEGLLVMAKHEKQHLFIEKPTEIH